MRYRLFVLRQRLYLTILGVGAALLWVPRAYAEWTPLIASTDFAGIKADMLTAVAGLMAVVLIVLGIGVLIKVISR